MDIRRLFQFSQQKTESGKTVAALLKLRAGDRLTASVLDVEKGSDALLAIGRFKAYARLPLPVVTGQEVQIRVEEKGDHLRMVMVPRRGPSANVPDDGRMEIRQFEPVSDKPLLSAHSRSLVPGESVRGRITGFEKEGLMLVDFGKFKAFAKIDIPVRQGQTIPLKVVKSENGLTFALAPKERSPADTGAPPPHAARVTASPVPTRCGPTDRGSTTASSGTGGHTFSTCGRCGCNRHRPFTPAHGC
jgi:hypothetical protein